MPGTPFRVYQVAIPSPLRKLFDYLPLEDETEALQPGCRVRVRFGNRSLVGIIIGTTNTSDVPREKLKSVVEVLDPTPLVSADLFALYQWAASYYQHPVGDALMSAFPALLRKGENIPKDQQRHWQLTCHGKGLPENALQRAPRQQQLLNALQQQATITAEQIKTRGISRQVIKQLEGKGLIEPIDTDLPAADWQQQNPLAESVLTLYPEQQEAIQQFSVDGFHTYLLHGETGSGKTEVYLQLIEKVIRNGKQAMVLIPEINLTPQTLKRFQTRFACPVALMHSGLTDRERAIAWNQARTGVAPIVLGTRSTVFTPLKHPGLIIIDEEHDSSFKQQDGFHYSARDVAVMRAKKENIPLLLGSATPSLESLYNCSTGRYTKLILSTRPGTAQLPEWQLLDMRECQLNAGFSAKLIAAMEQELQQGNQVLVFLNRRGFSPTMSCHSCGWIANCHRCEARLTVHRSINRLLCHHCEHQLPVPYQCPNCHSGKLQFIGQGTERSESILEALFPSTPILRVDRDSTRKKKSMQAVIDQINSGKPCILVGTQMLAKGHHFPNVTLVVILDADAGLFSPDFRAPEKMGQLITQVAGRAGRGDKPGRVILQSRHCDHPLITLISQEGYSSFSQALLGERNLTDMPPFTYLALIRAQSHSKTDAEKFLQYARKQAEKLSPPSNKIRYLGPMSPAMEKRSGMFRQQLTITSQQRGELQRLLTTLCGQLEAMPLARRVRWSVDVDPQEVG